MAERNGAPRSGELRATNLIKQYMPRSGLFKPRGATPFAAVDDVSLTVRAGQTVALVGESGSGKSTLGRLLVRLEDPTSGSLTLDGRDIGPVRGRALRRLRRRLQIIFQNPYEALDPRHTVGEAVEEPLLLQGVKSRPERTALVREALEAVGLTPPERFLHVLPSLLSGGQRQRVAIARGVVLKPTVLVADEPVSMLDASIRAGILNLMLELQVRLNLMLVFVTHDLASARYVAQDVLVMFRGQIVERGPIDEVLARPAHPYTIELLAAARGRALEDRVADPAGVGPESCRYADRCPFVQAICRTTPPPEVPVGNGRQSRCHFASAVLESGAAAEAVAKAV